MRLLTDKEMFSHIPQKDGSILYDDTAYYALDLNVVYSAELSDCPHLKGFEHRTSASASSTEKEASLQKRLDKIWHNTFLYIEPKIERYLDAYNGFIGRFPPSVRPSFTDSKGQVIDFEYFNSAPKGYICPREERLHKQHQTMQNPAASRFFRTLWGGILSLFLILFFLAVPGILNAVPAAKAFLAARTVLCYSLVAVPSIVVVIVGLFLPLHLLGKKIELDKFFPKAVVMFGLGYGSAGVLLIDLTSDATAPADIGLKYLLLAYLAAAVIFYIVRLFKALPAYREFLRRRTQLRAEFVKIYDQDAHMLHRYLRLRQLWFAWEYGDTRPMPRWYKRIEKRFQTYTKLYNKFK